MTPEERQQRIREVADRLAERLAEQWPEGDMHINDLEAFAERMGQEVQREVSERVLREHAEHQEGNQTSCPCGGVATYRRHHALTVVTAAGRLCLRRAYFCCRTCGKGQCPADARLGLGPANTTPTAQARLAVLGAFSPFVQVADLAAQLGLPLQLDIKSTERVAQAVGKRLQAATLCPYGVTERKVALAVDGIMLPTWEGNKETRCAVIYEPDWEAGRTPEAEAGLRKEYLATTGSRESLVRAACARAVARCGPQGLLTVLGDAAALDWVDLREYLQGRVAAWVEILDFYHVTERLGKIATAMHPADPTAAAAWRTSMKKELLDWGPRKLLEGLRAWDPREATAREVRRVHLGYFEGQQERMRYPDYLRRGLPIGSGAIEGACKHLVSDRFKRSGMRWQTPTAEPVLHLRAALLTQPRLDLRPYAGGPVAASA
jgi:hypothetical protein